MSRGRATSSAGAVATPKADAEHARLLDLDDVDGVNAWEVAFLLMRDFARTLERELSTRSSARFVDRGDAVNLVYDLRSYGDNALNKITMHGLRCLFDAIEQMDEALKEPGW